MWIPSQGSIRQEILTASTQPSLDGFISSFCGISPECSIGATLLGLGISSLDDLLLLVMEAHQEHLMAKPDRVVNAFRDLTAFEAKKEHGHILDCTMGGAEGVSRPLAPSVESTSSYGGRYLVRSLNTSPVSSQETPQMSQKGTVMTEITTEATDVPPYSGVIDEIDIEGLLETDVLQDAGLKTPEGKKLVGKALEFAHIHLTPLQRQLLRVRSLHRNA